MERSQKENLVGELQGIFNSATAAVLIDYRGLAANELVEMRQELHKVHSTMKVLKNTLAKLAVEETPFSGIRDQFVDTRALVYGQEDPVEQAKVLVKIAEKNPNLKIHAGVLVDSSKTSVLFFLMLFILAFSFKTSWYKALNFFTCAVSGKRIILPFFCH